MRLEQSIEIDAAPDRVFSFFDAMEENYVRWHPDHLSFRWLQSGRLAVGNRFRFEERVHGQRIDRVVRLTEIVPGRMIAFVPENPFVRFLLPRIAFAIESRGEGSRFTQTVRVRVGPIGRRLNRRGFAAVEKHMREEGENLKAIVEAGG